MGTQKSPGKTIDRMNRVPKLPRKVREDIRLSPSEVEELKARNPIMPDGYQASSHI